MAIDAQWLQTPPLCLSAHAIAVSLGAMKPPKDTVKSTDTAGAKGFADDVIDADDPDFVDFLGKLGSFSGY